MSVMESKVVFVGAGNMAEAIVSAFPVSASHEVCQTHVTHYAQNS